MKNVSNTEAYSTFDHIFLKALRSISNVVSVGKLTQPFWGRWRASNIGDDVLFDFLNSIRNLDDWPNAALRMMEHEEEAYEKIEPNLNDAEKVKYLRRLSYVGNLGQWGILPISDIKRSVYSKCRDYYLQSEQLAYSNRFIRFLISWNGKKYPANLHLPTNTNKKAPLIVVIHGLDDCKEEHLATELTLLEAGFAVVGFDGPGQGEAFLLEGQLWTPEFHGIISAIADQLKDNPSINTNKIGTVGFSIGSMWSILASSQDRRIKAVYDLGAPINTDAFARVPFLIKSKMCQITGARTSKEISKVLSENYIDREEILKNIRAAIRIAHGLKDRVVATKDKVWLSEELDRIGNCSSVSMITFEDGDHCCTNHVPAIRDDMANFFTSNLLT